MWQGTPIFLSFRVSRCSFELYCGSIFRGINFPLSPDHDLDYSWKQLGSFLCLLARIAAALEKATAETLEDRDSELTVELLYDGECPICHREICFLQKREDKTKVKFINIASKDYLASEHKNIDYEAAMGQIHAIDSKGNLLVGLPAFAAVYACQLLAIATVFRLPFLQIFLKPLYLLFAKNRLWITGRKTNIKQ